MKRFIVPFIAVIVLLVGCQSGMTKQHKPSIDDIESGIIEYENKQLPLFLQSHNVIHSITIDSLVIIQDTEPYSGYLSTTWDIDEKVDLTGSQWAANGYKDKYERKTKTVLVRVSNIKISSDGSYTWFSNWEVAFLEVKDAL